MMNTVDNNKDKYTRRVIQRAELARRIQIIIGRPGSRQFAEIIDNNLLPNSPITRADINAADDILGRNLGYLKGKTTARANKHVPGCVWTVCHQTS